MIFDFFAGRFEEDIPDENESGGSCAAKTPGTDFHVGDQESNL